jgi:hypothetical protein
MGIEEGWQRRQRRLVHVLLGLLAIPDPFEQAE